MTDIDLSKLADYFPAKDIEWRIRTAGRNDRGIWAKALAYVTARACQSRLDAVCGPERWRLEEPRPLSLGDRTGFACGLSIYVNDTLGWVTKFDTAELTQVEPLKGGWSSAVKRAAAAWGVARYLYHLPESFAETSPDRQDGWHWGSLPQKEGGGGFYWRDPTLPGWALPKEKEHEVDQHMLNVLKTKWRDKFAASDADAADLRGGFGQFVRSLCGEFPIDDHTTWSAQAMTKCLERIAATDDPADISPDVPFTE